MTGAGPKAKHEKAVAFLEAQRLEESLTAFDDAIANFKAIIAAGQTQWSGDLVRALAGRAQTLCVLGRLDEALTAYGDAIDDFRALIAAGQTQWAGDLIQALEGRARTLLFLSRLDEALTTYGEAIDGYRALVAAGQTQWAGDLVRALAGRAQTLDALDRLDEALTTYGEAIDGYRALIAAGQTEWSGDLVQVLEGRAQTLLVLGRLDEALTACEDAIDGYRALIAAGQTHWAGNLVRALEGRAQTLGFLGRLDEALTAYGEAVDDFRALIAAGQTGWSGDLVQTLAGQAQMLGALSRYDEALTVHGEAIHGYRALIAAGQARWSGDLFQALAGRAQTLHFLGRLDEALTGYGEAIDGYRALIAAGQTQWSVDLFQALGGRAQTSAIAGQATDSQTDIDEALALADRYGAVLEPTLFAGIAETTATIFKASRGPCGDTFEALYRRSRSHLDQYLAQVADPKEEEALQAFWSHWIETFVVCQRYDLVLDAVASAHGRHAAAQALAALELERIRLDALGDTETERYLDLHRRLHQIQVALANFNDHGSGGSGGMRGGGLASEETDPESMAQRYTALQRAEQSLRDEWRGLGRQLIDAGKLPEAIAAGTMTEADLRPKSGQALAVWIVPQEFGMNVPPFLLLRNGSSKDTEALFLEDGEFPDFARAAAVGEALAEAMAYGRCVRDAGNGGTKKGADTNAPLAQASASELDEALRGFLAEQVWPRIEAHCQATPGWDQTLHLITTGGMHALPWQGTAAERGRHLYLHPGPFAYTKYRKARGDAESRERPRPSPELPLLVLAHEAAEDINHRLYCIPLEVAILKAVWGDGAVVVGEPSVPGPYAALVCMGHGHFDSQTGRAGLVQGFGPPPVSFDEQRLAADASRYSHVEASACLLGRVTDQRNEPAGMMAAALARSQVTLATGALMPVDDLLATLRTLLVHVLWKEGRSLRAATREALACMESGEWPDAAIRPLRWALAATLGGIIRAMEDNAAMVEDDARIASLRNELTLAGSPPEVSDKAKDMWRTIVRKQRRQPGESAETDIGQLADLLAAHLPEQVRTTPDLLAFTRYWMVC